MKKRPVGIPLLGIPLIFLRMLSLCWSGFAFRFGAPTATFGNWLGAQRLGGFGSQAAWQGAIGLIAAIVQIIVGGDLFGLKRWAWVLAFLPIALNVAQGVLSMIRGGFFSICCGAFWLLIPIGIPIHLLTPAARSAFSKVPPCLPPTEVTPPSAPQSEWVADQQDPPLHPHPSAPTSDPLRFLASARALR